MWAQETYPEVYYYYVEEKEAGDLEPLSKTRDGESQVLTLTFENNEFNSFINNQTVYVFKKAFPGALTERLQRMYLIGATSQDLLDDFYGFNQIPYSDYLGTLELTSLSINPEYLPDDYNSTEFISPQLIEGSSNKHLDLINAKQAWNIETGDSKTMIGIIDRELNINHPDLANKIFAHYGSVYNNPNDFHYHGTKVAGCAAAETDNDMGIASIGYENNLVTLDQDNFNIPTYPNFSGVTTYANQALFLVKNHNPKFKDYSPAINVLSLSFKSGCNYILADDLLFKELWDEYQVVTVAAAGNGSFRYPQYPGESCPDSNGGRNGYVYPASYEHVISVSSVGHHYPIGYVRPTDNKSIGWKDVHEFEVGDATKTFTHNDKVDIVAPAYGVPSTNGSNEYSQGYGTSFAAPIVAGVAAQMFAAGPSRFNSQGMPFVTNGVTADRVKQYIMDTAKDIYTIPENAPYIGQLGAGRINAHGAILKARCLYGNQYTNLDLMMHSTPDDVGKEPHNVDPIWNSPDIWVRNQPDGHIIQEHQDLHYVSNQTPVYVYVRITNNSCETSDGTEQLYLYWAKGGISQDWPIIWEGATGGPGNLQIGDDVGNLNIPVLEPGESTILEFEWQPYDPDIYQADGYAKPWMFCFLARIVTPNDPMTFTEVTNASTNAKNNNNIAYKNTTVLNVTGGPKGTITAGNYFSESPTVANFNFFTIDANDTNIWEQAEISIELDNTIWSNWLSNDGQGSNYEIVNEEEHRILLTGNHAQLTNVPFGSNEGGLITLEVNFLTDEVDSQDNFALHIEQYDVSRDESKGGFTFNVKRDVSRPDFEAEGERERINNITTLNANSINEPATYNWYDSNGDLVYSGEQLTVTSHIAQEYKLEIIADSDGHKDYAIINSESLYTLQSLSPNPANDQVQVAYEAQGATSGYISITSTQTAVSNNYILNVNDPNLSVDVSSYTPGTYVVALFCDGKIVETKNLVIQ